MVEAKEMQRGVSDLWKAFWLEMQALVVVTKRRVTCFELSPCSDPSLASPGELHPCECLGKVVCEDCYAGRAERWETWEGAQAGSGLKCGPECQIGSNACFAGCRKRSKRWLGDKTCWFWFSCMDFKGSHPWGGGTTKSGWELGQKRVDLREWKVTGRLLALSAGNVTQKEGTEIKYAAMCLRE